MRVPVEVSVDGCAGRVVSGGVPDDFVGGGGLSLPPPVVDGVPPGLVALDGFLSRLLGSSGGGA